VHETGSTIVHSGVNLKVCNGDGRSRELCVDLIEGDWDWF